MKPRGRFILLPATRSGAGTAGELAAQSAALTAARVKGGKRRAASVRAARRWARKAT